MYNNTGHSERHGIAVTIMEWRDIMAREALFQPIMIGKTEIKNRLAMAPMGAFGLVDPECCYTERAAEYYVERARGGVGLIITSITKVENELDRVKPGLIPITSINPARFAMTSAEMTERCHAYGTKIFLQLSMGFGRSGAPALLDGPPVSASAIPNYWDPRVSCRELTTAEVERIVKKFGEAAALAKHIGFDGVEIHAVHEGYLLDQFTLSIFNRRTDKYGGDLAGRMTLPCEIVREVKRYAGEDFPVILRYSIKSCIKGWRQGGLPGEDYEEKGRDVKEGLEAAKMLQEAGYDAFDADAGTYDAWYWAHPPVYQKHGCYLELAAELKKVATIPVIVAGKMDIPEMAAAAVERKQADMIGLGRALLADAYWPKKVASDVERRIRPCIGCHIGCLGRGFEGKPLCCAVNPEACRESFYRITPSLVSKNVMVAGGGPAGMETARVAKLRGHSVTLYESTDQLGGNFIAASIPDFKYDDRRLIEWYRNEMNELKINVVLNTPVDDELITAKKPDVLIIATGSTEKMLKVAGSEKPKVATAVQLLTGSKSAGRNVVMIGGGLVGCETALYLARQGSSVTIVEALGDILSSGHPVPHMNRMMLIDMLKNNGVKIITDSALLEVEDQGAVIIDSHFRQSALPADTVGIAVGFDSNRALYDSMRAKTVELYLVGDAEDASDVMNAIWSAYEVAMNI